MEALTFVLLLLLQYMTCVKVLTKIIIEDLRLLSKLVGNQEIILMITFNRACEVITKTVIESKKVD